MELTLIRYFDVVCGTRPRADPWGACRPDRTAEDPGAVFFLPDEAPQQTAVVFAAALSKTT